MFGLSQLVDPYAKLAIKVLLDSDINVRLMTPKRRQNVADVAEKAGLATNWIQTSDVNYIAAHDLIQQISSEHRVITETSQQQAESIARRLGTCAVFGSEYKRAFATAGVKFSKGITGSALEKEASDVIVLDDSLMSVCKALLLSRRLETHFYQAFSLFATLLMSQILLTFFVAFSIKQNTFTLLQTAFMNTLLPMFGVLTIIKNTPQQLTQSYE